MQPPRRARKQVPVRAQTHPFTSYTQSDAARAYRDYAPCHLASRLTAAEQDAIRRRLDRELFARLNAA